MKTIFFPDEYVVDGSYAATIGFFDGVHQGHRYLMERLKSEAQRRGLQSMVITFDHHPRQVVQDGWQPELLTTLSEKTALIGLSGIDILVVLRFDRQMASLSARDFMQQMHDRLRVACLLTGYDNRFGHDRTECFDDYRHYGQELGMAVIGIEEHVRVGDCKDETNEGVPAVSSSYIRRLLKEGKVEAAGQCLGHPYSLTGHVVHGEQIGRTLGFPTANLQPDGCKLIPADGVYAVVVDIEPPSPVKESEQEVRKGVMNIGPRPTFDGRVRTLEVNIIDGTGNYYGKTMTVHFIARLRDERHFPSAEALAAQIKKDKQQAEELFSRCEVRGTRCEVRGARIEKIVNCEL